MKVTLLRPTVTKLSLLLLAFLATTQCANVTDTDKLIRTGDNSTTTTDTTNKSVVDTHRYNVLYPNSSIVDEYVYQHATGPCMNNYNCFYPFGICLNDTVCLCMPEYANIYIQHESLHEMSCSYRKKKVVVAGLLEL